MQSDIGTVEYYHLHNPHMLELRSMSGSQGIVKKCRPALSLAEGKAAALVTRGVYTQYVNTPKGRPACAKLLRRRQGTPLAAFFTIPI